MAVLLGLLLVLSVGIHAEEKKDILSEPQGGSGNVSVLMKPVNIILAVDTSAYADRDYIESISNAVNKLLDDLSKENKDIRIGLVSWDDDIDFAVSPTLSNRQISDALNKLYAKEDEIADFNVAILGSTYSIKSKNKSNCTNIIILIVPDERSFIPLNRTLLASIRNEYKIYGIILEPREESKCIKELGLITKSSGGQWYSALNIQEEIYELLRIIINQVDRQGEGPERVRRISSSTVKSMINETSENSPISFCNYIIDGNLIITQSHIDRDLIFRNCTFNGVVDFQCASFKKSISFIENRFDNDVYFNGAIDSDASSFADFTDSEFKSDADFSNFEFNGPAYFNHTKFNQNADFFSTNFNNDAIFESSQFNGFANFTKSNFNGPAFFIGASFNGPAAFIGSSFYGDANFESSKFNEPTDFTMANFNRSVQFRSSEFTETANFKEASFNSITDFRGSMFKGSLELTKAKINPFENFFWPYAVNQITCEDVITYTELIKHFRNLGQFAAADDIYYQYRDWCRDQNTGLSKLVDYLAWASCGYGVKPERPIICAIVMLILFGSLFFIGLRSGKPRSETAAHPAASNGASKAPPHKDGTRLSSSIAKINTYALYPIRSKLRGITINKVKFMEVAIKSLAMSSVALFSLPRELYPYEEEYMNIIGQKISIIPFRLLVLIERLIGWGLLILFINTLSRVMVRY